MSEHKFNVGDRVIDKNFSGQVLIVKRVYQDVIDDVVDVYREGDDSTIVKYFSKNLEPVSYHIMKADEIAELFKETEEKDKKEHTLPNPADLLESDKKVQQIYDRVISQMDYDRGYEAGHKAGFDEGFIVGMKAVIRNVTRFLKEIQP